MTAVITYRNSDRPIVFFSMGIGGIQYFLYIRLLKIGFNCQHGSLLLIFNWFMSPFCHDFGSLKQMPREAFPFVF